MAGSCRYLREKVPSPTTPLFCFEFFFPAHSDAQVGLEVSTVSHIVSANNVSNVRHALRSEGTRSDLSSPAEASKGKSVCAGG